MRSGNRIVWILLASLFFAPGIDSKLEAQSIIFDLPDNLIVCQSDDLQMLVRNTSSENLTITELELTLPCGLEYISGSVQGAFIKDESNPREPVFSLPDLAPGESLNLKVKLTAPCSTIECIDSGALLRINALLISSQGEVTFQSSQFNIETAQAVITRIDYPILTGEKGDVITRKIYIRNSRPGYLDTMIFTDKFQSGLTISSDLGLDISSQAGSFEAMLSGNDFKRFGDGDALFEFNEEIIIIETIHIDACGFNTSSIRSDLDVSWGCMGTRCPSPFPPQTALINLRFSIVEGPILEFFPEATSPCCYCGDQAARQSMIVRNFSDVHSASSISVTIDSEAFPDSGFSPEDVLMETEDMDVVLSPTFFDVNDKVCSALQQSFYVIIPSIDPGEEVRLSWNAYFCNREPCLADPYKWNYRSGYRKDCTINTDDYHNDADISQPSESVLLRTSYGPVPNFEYLQEETLEIEVFSPFLTQKTGTLDIELKVSCQLDVLEEDWLLNNVPPISISSEVLNDETVFQLSYQLPLDFNTGEITFDVQCLCTDLCGPDYCQEEFVSSCASPCEGEVFLFDISTITQLNIDECNGECLIEYCDFQVYNYDCELPVCETVVDGYLLGDFDIYRLNTGLPDNNNDHLPEPSGILNLDSIRLDRAITGDTLRAEIKAEVIIDVEGASFENGIIDLTTKLIDTEGMDPLFQFLEYGRLLDPGNGLINIFTELKIVDASSGQTYTCNKIPTFDQDSTGINSFDISLQKLRGKGCSSLPFDYRYESGDSIYLVADFFINHNLESLLLNFGKMRLEVLNTNTLYNGSIEGLDPFTCQCNLKTLEIANYKTVVTSNGMSVEYCYGEGEGFSKIIKFGTFTDFFPYEYKPPVMLDALLMPRVEGVELTEAWIISIFSNGQPVLVNLLDTSSYMPLSFTEIDSDTFLFETAESQTGFYMFDPNESLDLPWDENLEFRIFFRYRNLGCIFGGTQDYFGLNNVSYSSGIEKTTVKTDTMHQVILLGKQVFPELNINLCEVTSFSDVLQWDLQLSYDLLYDSNLDTTVNHSWIYPYSMNGNLADFEIVNLETGISINKAGDIFQLGPLSKGDTLHMRLSALSTSCNTEIISIAYGWHCEPFTDPEQFVCDSDTIICSGITPPGVIDLLVDSSSLSAILCDTFPRIELEIFNAGLGSLTGIYLVSKLPPGMSIVENSSRLEYYSGSMNIFEISDPEVLPGNTLLWTIENEFSGATGSLPGVNSFPENSFTVSFLVKSDCEFISGSRLIFETGSSLLCGEQSNTVSKISGPLFLSDAEPAYQADIRLEDSTIDGCSDTAELIVQIATGEETSLFDEVSIQLPSGLTYIDGSCIGGLEDCNPSENNGLLSWYLPSERMELEFSFAVKGIDSLDCGRIFLPLYTTTRTNILCIEDSSSCSVKIATGESIEQLMIERPDFDIKEVKVFFDDLQTLIPGFEISLENSSVANSDSILISLYLDSDGSNDLSSPDSLFTEYVFNESVSTGQRIDLIMEKVNLPPDELCRLLFVIDEEKNCVCTGDVFPFKGEILIDSFESYTICSGDTLTIGIVEETGAIYEWSGIENLACQDCSTVTISIRNEEFGLLQENIFLSVTNDNGCQTTYEYLVNIVPKPRILSKDHLICEGEELTLLASDAESYSWEGPGITDIGLQVQILYPQESGNYNVTITDTYGCTSIDSAFVTVRPLPSASAGEDQLVCYGPEVFLEALDTMTGNSYSWTPGFPFLELPGEAKTRVLIYQDQEYILSVFDGHCFNYDTVYLDFFDGLDFDGPEDITICSGDPVMISLPDSLNYSWVPFFSDMCLDSSCADVIFYPETSLTLEIIAVSEDQCLDTSILTVHVQEEMETEILEAGICPGDSVEWFGQFYFEEGLYCETQVNQEGCTFQSCLDVSIFTVNQLEISADVLVIDPGTSVQLEATPGFGMYLWNETPSLSCLDCPDPIASPIEDEFFVLMATDQNGCIQADSIAIGLLAQCVLDDVLIPNAFTPNKNDKNDRFRIANLNSEFWEVHVEVYDRWGKQLFEGFDNSGWDGSFEGEDVPEGVYLYIIRVDCGNGEEELFKGNVTLIR